MFILKRNSFKSLICSKLTTNSLNYHSKSITFTAKNELSALSLYFYNLVQSNLNSKYDDLIKSQKFIRNCEYTSNLLKVNQIENLKLVDQISILRSLQLLNFPSNHELISFLIRLININLNNLSVERALKVLTNQINYQETQEQKVFVKNLIEYIENNYKELKTLENVLLIYDEKFQNVFSNNFFVKIDLLALDLFKKIDKNYFKTEDLTLFLFKLSSINRRPKPLISLILNYLNNKNLDEFDVKKAINTINSLTKLNYLSIELLNKLNSHLISNNFIESINKYEFSSLLECFIKLNYNPQEILEYLLSNIDYLNKKFGKKCLINLFNTTAHFNFQSNNLKSDIEKNLLRSVDYNKLKDEILLINYFWTLAFYDKLVFIPPNIFSTKFSEELSKKPYFNIVKLKYILLYNYCQKKLNLNYEIPESFFKTESKTKKNNSFLLEDLSVLINKNNIKTNFDAKLGLNFDFAFLSDKNMRTKSFENFEEAKLLCNNDFKLFLIYIFDKKEICLNSSNKFGHFEMMNKICKLTGLNVIFLDMSKLAGLTKIDIAKTMKYMIIEGFNS